MAPPALVATVGGATSNTYVTQANATIYFSARPNVALWTAAASDQKDEALLFAASLFEREKWKGVKGMTPAGALTQALSWPRRWAPTREVDAEPEMITSEWEDLTLAYYSELAIPVPVIRGQCELALEILRAGTSDPFAAGGTAGEGITSEKVDVLATDYLGIADRSSGLGRFPSVIAEVAHLLRESGATEVERV